LFDANVKFYRVFGSSTFFSFFACSNEYSEWQQELKPVAIWQVGRPTLARGHLVLVGGGKSAISLI
jgi:hypothetical protein